MRWIGKEQKRRVVDEEECRVYKYRRCTVAIIAGREHACKQASNSRSAVPRQAFFTYKDSSL
jgi:hypothetical protein